jgi:4-aminobutyrate aminotransferase-like enzyme
LRDACRLDPCPESAAITGWIRAHSADLARVVGADLSRADNPVFDLSVGGGELGVSDPTDADGFTDLLFDRLRAAGAEVGIGRYGEARLCYVADRFDADSDGMPERRTIHLGIDLFQEPGSPVFAPLDGTVHGLANNDEPLDYGPTILLRHETDDGSSFYTLYGHLTEDSLRELRPGLPIRKGQRIAAIGAPPVNGGWPPHLHFQLIVDVLNEQGNFPGVATPSTRRVWKSICPDPNAILRIPVELLCSGSMGRDEILAERERHLGPSLSLSYRKPLELVRGRGARLYDPEGRAYLDAVNNVPHVGHCHPRVVEAGRRQMGVLNTNTRYLHESLARYTSRLAGLLPEPLEVCYLVCSGSEANELALRLARAHTGRRDVIVVEGGYHGNTQALIDVSSYKFDGPGGEGAPPHVHVTPLPDGYRGPYRGAGAETGRRYATHVADAADEAARRGGGVGAFLCEPLPGCAGQIVPPDAYLQECYAHVRSAGGVCIADEVQVGFGRVGSHLWAFETQGVVPDIMTLGKPIGNGHPLAAVVTTREIAESFANGMEYFNTFGGNPVSCAVGLAVLDVIRDERLQRNASRAGSLLKEGLLGLKERHPLIGDVRGLGLFLGVELVLDRETLEPAAERAAYVAERMKERGVLLGTDGLFRNVLKIKPPLVFDERDAARLLETLDDVLGESWLRGRRPTVGP